MASKKKDDLRAALMGVAQTSKGYSQAVAKKEPVPPLQALVETDPHYQILSIFDLEDAPAEWNKYPRIKDINTEKYLELKADIAANGILEPLRVWSRNGKYMIVSGHNRRDILLELYEEYPEQKEQYAKQVCYVIGEKERTEEEIRREIHSTNVHRDMNDISKRTQMEILDDRIALMMENRTPKGEDVLRLAEKMGIKKSKLYDLLTIRNDLIPGLKELYFDGKLSVKAAVKIASLNVKVQENIRDKHKDKLNTNAVKNMPKDLFNKGLADTAKNVMVDEFFSREESEVQTVRMSVSIPMGREKEFQEMVEEWIKNLK